MEAERPLKRIFVYGTLLEGGRNYNKILANKVKSVEKAFLYGKLYYLPQYDCPALLDGEDKVFGEVLTLSDDDLLSCMDKLEEFTGELKTSVYVRIPRIIYLAGDKEILDVYLFANRDLVKEIHYIPHGSWREFIKHDQKTRIRSIS